MILRDCGLDETIKWSKPCYTFEKSNIAIIQPFNDSCALMFFKGEMIRRTCWKRRIEKYIDKILAGKGLRE